MGTSSNRLPTPSKPESSDSQRIVAGAIGGAILGAALGGAPGLIAGLIAGAFLVDQVAKQEQKKK